MSLKAWHVPDTQNQSSQAKEIQLESAGPMLE